MKSLILHPHEVLELGQAGEVEIMRPIKWPVRSLPHRGERILHETVHHVAVALGYPEDDKHPLARVDCPFGLHGEIRWVRETWSKVPRTAYWHDPSIPHQEMMEPSGYGWWAVYRASWERCSPGWKSSATMPRWASRYTVKVLAVGVAEVEEAGFWFLRLGKVDS